MPTLDATAGHEPVRIVSASPGGAPAKMIDLFEMDGVMHQIPAKPRINLVLRFLFQAKTLGEDMAAANLLESLIGTDGFAALVNYDDLEPDQFQQILAIAQKVSMGELERVMGESARGPNR